MFTQPDYQTIKFEQQERITQAAMRRLADRARREAKLARQSIQIEPSWWRIQRIFTGLPLPRRIKPTFA